MNMKKQIVLASKSPRRKKLLKDLGINFKVHPSKFEEKDTALSPEILALHNAKGKARDIAKHYKDAVIIGVDTVGAYKNHILNKPKDDKDALRILKTISGTTHYVISAICLIDTKTGKEVSATEKTAIQMDRLTIKQMKAYIASGEGRDKAASYAIQGQGSLFIRKITGDYFNVVGLPMYRLRKLGEKLQLKFDIS